LVTFYRSSSKPLQALPLARERDDVTEVELAIACASHRAEPSQLEAARSLLDRAPATEADLELGPAGGTRPEPPLAQLLRQARGFPRRLPRARLAESRATVWRSTRSSSCCSRETAAAADLGEDDVATGRRRVRRPDLRNEPRAHGLYVLTARPAGGKREDRGRDDGHPELIGYERGAVDPT
jgi:hypothetical protein